MIETRTFFGMIGAVALLGGAAFAEDKSSHEASEKPIELSQVPAPARAAAEKDLGGKATEAKVLEENGEQVYELEARGADGKEKAVHVSAAGKILSHEDESGEDKD